MALVKATPERVISIALFYEYYLEKASNSQLDDFKANAGRGNYTKFARDLDGIPGFYNGKKQGFPWCGVAHDAWHVYAFGEEAAKKLLCRPDQSLGAGCGFAARYYQAKGQFHKSNPKPGDQIFFLDSAGDIGHTGLVYKVDNIYVYTVEGNTSPQDGVVGNGDGVYRKQYALSDRRIYGFGRPDYNNVWYDDTVVIIIPEGKPEAEKIKNGFSIEMRVLKKGCFGDDVRALQNLLIANGWDGGDWGADGNFGKQTEDAVKAYQSRNGLQDDGKAGPETWASLLGLD